MPPGIAAVDKPIIITFLAMEKVIFRFVLYEHRSRRKGSDGSEIFSFLLFRGEWRMRSEGAEMEIVHLERSEPPRTGNIHFGYLFHDSSGVFTLWSNDGVTALIAIRAAT